MKVTRALKLTPEYGGYHYEVRPCPIDPESALELAYCKGWDPQPFLMTLDKAEALAIGKALIEFAVTLK